MSKINRILDGQKAIKELKEHFLNKVIETELGPVKIIYVGPARSELMTLRLACQACAEDENIYLTMQNDGSFAVDSLGGVTATTKTLVNFLSQLDKGLTLLST